MKPFNLKKIIALSKEPKISVWDKIKYNGEILEISNILIQTEVYGQFFKKEVDSIAIRSLADDPSPYAEFYIITKDTNFNEKILSNRDFSINLIEIPTEEELVGFQNEDLV